MLIEIETNKCPDIPDLKKFEREVKAEVVGIDDKYKNSKRFWNWAKGLFSGVAFFEKFCGGVYRFQHDCGHVWTEEKARQGKVIKCPHCGKAVKSYNLKFNPPESQHRVISVLYKGKYGAISRLITLYKNFSYSRPDGNNGPKIAKISWNILEEQRDILTWDGKYIGKIHETTKRNVPYWASGRGKSHGQCYNRWYAEDEYVYTYPNSIKGIFNGTIFQYSQFEIAAKVSRLSIIEYLPYYLKYPKLEMLYKVGLYKLAHQLMRTNYEWQNDFRNRKSDALRRAKTLKDIGIVTKEDLKLAVREDLGYDEVQAWSEVKFWKLKKKELDFALNFMYGIFDVHDYGFKYDFIRNESLFRYCMAQVEQENSKKKIVDFLRDYRDYADDCKHLHFDLSDKHINRPKDFKAMHDHMKDVRKYNDNHLYDDAMIAAYDYLHGFVEYEDKKFKVIMAKTPQDLIDEGNANNHCVAKYAEHVAKGESVVCFIRKVGEEDKSFCTMELKPDMVHYDLAQCRGKNNEDAPKAVETFLKKYEKWFNSRPATGFDESRLVARYYKAVLKVKGEYVSIWDGKTKYKIGEIKETETDKNPDNVATNGLHIASLEFAQDFGKGRKNAVILEVEVNLHDIIVPDAKDQIRTSKFKVLREVPASELGEWGRQHYKEVA